MLSRFQDVFHEQTDPFSFFCQMLSPWRVRAFNRGPSTQQHSPPRGPDFPQAKSSHLEPGTEVGSSYPQLHLIPGSRTVILVPTFSKTKKSEQRSNKGFVSPEL